MSLFFLFGNSETQNLKTSEFFKSTTPNSYIIKTLFFLTRNLFLDNGFSPLRRWLIPLECQL